MWQNPSREKGWLWLRVPEGSSLSWLEDIAVGRESNRRVAVAGHVTSYTQESWRDQQMGLRYKAGRPVSGFPPPPKRLYLLKFLQLPQTLLSVREQMFKAVLWRMVHIQIIRPHDCQTAPALRERVMYRLGGHYWSRPFNHRTVGSFR